MPEAQAWPNVADYVDVIKRLPSQLDKVDVLGKELLLAAAWSGQRRQRRVEIYFCPWNYEAQDPLVVLLGVTPGWTQVQKAFATARDALDAGCSLEEMGRRVEGAASFSGQMRPTLVGWLNELGLPGLLSPFAGRVVRSANDFFDRSLDLAELGSVVSYPVFVDGENYTGASPDLATFPLFKPYIGRLAASLAAKPRALVIPMGDRVSDVLSLLGARDPVLARRSLVGFPHPSGQNGHRFQKWEAHRDQLARKTEKWFEALAAERPR